MFIRTTSHAWEHRGRNLGFHVGLVNRQLVDTTEALTLHSDPHLGKVWGLSALLWGTELVMETQE